MASSGALSRSLTEKTLLRLWEEGRRRNDSTHVTARVHMHEMMGGARRARMTDCFGTRVCQHLTVWRVAVRDVSSGR